MTNLDCCNSAIQCSQMESSWIDQLVLPNWEPIAHLDPYLSGIDLATTDESLDKLTGHGQAPQVSSPPPCRLSQHWASSPSCSSLISSSAGSPPESPLVRQQSQSSTSSWAPLSPASSCSSSRWSRQAGSGSKRARQTPYERSRNASATERYRLRLKGRKCNLQELVELEEQRNSELRRLLESKLSLYREFVQMLANNLQDEDIELATVGSRSIEAILGPKESSEVTCQDGTDSSIERIEQELGAQLVRFQQIANRQGTVLTADRVGCNDGLDDVLYKDLNIYSMGIKQINIF